MRITIFGAGALGSFIGGILSSRYRVGIIGRPHSIDIIKKEGITISGKTNLKVYPNISLSDCKNPDLLILTVKSFDTKRAIEDALSLITDKTLVLSLQNGVRNVDIIGDVVGMHRVLGGVTSHGVTLISSGKVMHTGVGDIMIGGMDGHITPRIKEIISVFRDVGLVVKPSRHISKEIWGKAIINAGINPITTVARCKNKYLVTNPSLEKLLELVCKEARDIVVSSGISIPPNLIGKAKMVARRTGDNYSSMFQSVLQHKRTEIDEINGEIVQLAERQGLEAPFNVFLISLVKAIEYNSAAVA